MAATATEVSTKRLVDTKHGSGRTKRRQWPEALKRQIVAESLAPGASVSLVARGHDVNANQVFKWRREVAPAPPIAERSVTLLPVEIVAEPDTPRSRARRTGMIEITLACGARICVRGEVSPEALRQVVELLR